MKATLEDMTPYIAAFCGALEVMTEEDEGFILIDKGNVTAAFLKDPQGIYKGKTALSRLSQVSSPEFSLRKYADAEYETALSICSSEGLIVENHAAPTEATPIVLDQEKLERLMKQPGVHAVSAFFEGFAVQSIGDADFDQVAAMAEDLLRAGTKISKDMRIGMLDQMILETGSGKLIIAPYGDLYLCVLANADTNLGLIRVALKGLLTEVS
ncbi:MAG TPA: roadblock/LC7 domain-containing protein [Methanomicrobiales archaeon]|nr:roadblock/LC7 domain-containing protein [Methanomicrobiales archaeon]